MGLLNFIKSQLIEIIEWLDDTNYTLVHRFPDQDREIKNGAKLIVREGQACIFVNKGQIADVFFPGMYTLSTDNMPVLSTIMGWKYGFHSPFKCEVYFVSTKRYLDQKWGTSNPVMMRDPEFGPVRIRAFGMYNFRVTDPAVFMREVVGTDGNFTVDEIEGQLKRKLVSIFSSSLAKAKLPVLEMAGQYQKVGETVLEAMQPSFSELGLNIVDFVIENISLPKEVEALMDQGSGVSVMGNRMPGYMQMQAAQAMREAAQNQSGGAAGSGMGLGAGFAMANMMGQNMMQGMVPPPQQQQQQQYQAAPPQGQMVACGKCNNQVNAAAKFCPNCGTPRNAACDNCQASLPAGAKFCGNCGKPAG